MSIPQHAIDRDTAALGERMARVEEQTERIAADIGRLTERFMEHEVADDRRHHEIVEAFGAVREELAKRNEDPPGAVWRGLTLRDIAAGITIVALVASIIAGAIRGEPLDPEAVARAVVAAQVQPVPPVGD